MDITLESATLSNLGRINVIIGKNGAGKSRLLRSLEQFFRSHRDQYQPTKYITPERGGEWQSDPSVQQNLLNVDGWGDNVRTRNRFEQYRQVAWAEFATLELGFYRRAENMQKQGEAFELDFDALLSKVNKLLDNVVITRPDAAVSTTQGYPVKPRNGQDYGQNFMSSGESELVTLGCEIVSFAHHAKGAEFSAKQKFLLIDEPDVHLHPDLQQRLVDLIRGEVDTSEFNVIIATHSTAILAALQGFPEAKVSFLKSGMVDLNFRPISEAMEAVLPVFGAHPLSNVFNKTPILIVEGEDDERIWRQATRSSNRRISLWPVAATSKQKINEYEDCVEEIASAIYDAPRAFSLRDGDGVVEELDNKRIVVRFRLRCNSAENLLLTDDVLSAMEMTWAQCVEKFREWISANINARHPQIEAMKAFQTANFSRQDFDVKEIRNVIVGILGFSKEWEVVVGQAIARLTAQRGATGDHGLIAYLGDKIVRELQLSPAQ